MNNSVFGKTVENVRKRRNIKLITANKRRNLLVLEPNFETQIWFSEYLLAIEVNKCNNICNKKVLQFSYYKTCLLDSEIISKSQERLKVKQIMYILKNSTRLH